MNPMKTVKIIPLKNISPALWRAFRDGQKESAKVWMICRDLHCNARKNSLKWPGKVELQKATKGLLKLHSQKNSKRLPSCRRNFFVSSPL
jgi:putative transposase